MSDGLRNIKDAADWLGIPAKTLQGYVTARTVPFTKVGRHVRFSQAHLDAIVAAGEQPVAAAPPLRLVATGVRLESHPPAGPSSPPPPPGPKMPSKARTLRQAG